MPRFANALFIGTSAKKALEKNREGEVHSVFDRAFNILIGGELVGVARRDVPRSPINLIVDITPDTRMSSFIRRGAGVSVTGGTFKVGDELTVFLKKAEVWRPKKRVVKALETELIGHNLRVARGFASNRRESLGQLLSYMDEILLGEMPQGLKLNQVSRAALPHVMSLVDAVRSGDIDRVRRSSENLLGLGPGLSPAADDMLIGFMAGLRWAVGSLDGDVDRVDAINEAIVARASEKTTLLSQQLLRHAALGEVNETVQSSLEAILAGTAEDVEATVEKVLGIGETSGIDTVVGLLWGVQVGLEVLSLKCGA